jgi:hypothetical protein
LDVQSVSEEVEMPEMSNFNIWLAVNEDGDGAVSMDGADEARESLTEDYGGEMIRVAKLEVAIALPKVVTVKIEVPDEAGETQQVEAVAAE